MEVLLEVVLGRQCGTDPEAMVDILYNEESHEGLVESVIHRPYPVAEAAVPRAVVWRLLIFVEAIILHIFAQLLECGLALFLGLLLFLFLFVV